MRVSLFPLLGSDGPVPASNPCLPMGCVAHALPAGTSGLPAMGGPHGRAWGLPLASPAIPTPHSTVPRPAPSVCLPHTFCSRATLPLSITPFPTEGMHYNSVRNADDYGSGPPAPLRVGSAADLSAADPAALSAAQRSFGEREAARVLAGTGYADGARAARALEQCRGNVGEAIELLIEQLGNEEEEEGDGGGAVPAATAPEAAAVQEDAAGGREPRGAQQAASPSGKQQGATAAAAAEQRRHPVAGPVPSDQRLLRNGGQRPEDWSRVRLELALDPDEPGGGARVAIFPAGPQHAQHDQKEQGTQHALHDCITQEEAQGLGAGAAAAGGPVGSEEAGGKERASRKGARLKAKAVSHPGRNKPCPCGSKVKYKDCCARKDRRKAGSDPGAACAADTAAVAAAQLKVLLI